MTPTESLGFVKLSRRRRPRPGSTSHPAFAERARLAAALAASARENVRLQGASVAERATRQRVRRPKPAVPVG